MDGESRGTTATWESWECPRCHTHNSHRDFCFGCRLSRDEAEFPVPAGEMVPDENAVAPGGGRSKRKIAIVGVVVIALLLGAGGALIVHQTRSDGVHYPSAWDPRVADLATYVEHERGLRFKHPVAVDFLTPEQYHTEMTTEASTLSAKDKRDLERQTAVFRAVGLLTGKVDLLAAANKLSDDGTLAAYDPTDKRIRIRGTALTPALRVTLVHELTHVAQDQYYDIESNLSDSDDAGSGVFRALVEGDAERIENTYIDQLNEADSQAYETETNASADATTALADVPPALTVFFAAPYTLGSELVGLLDATGGNESVNDALETPPTNDVQLLDPFRYLNHETTPTVPALKLAKGDKLLDDGDFGALVLYLVLSGRIDDHEALRAADAWSADSSLDYEHNGRACVRVAIKATGVAGADQMQTALTDWAKTMPGADATVNRSGTTLTMQSCDPGENAVAPPGGGVTMEKLSLPAGRTDLALGLIKQGASPNVGRCIAGRLVDTFTTAQLSDPDPSHVSEDTKRQVQAFGAACR